MKACIVFEIGEDGREHATAQLITDDGEEIALAPCVACRVTSEGKNKRIALAMTFEIKADGQSEKSNA
jgi:hypothetical protein